MLCGIARRLDERQLAEIRTLEEELGLTIVAFACRAVDPVREQRLLAIAAELGPELIGPPAQPSEQQLARIRRLEEQTGLALVAVQT
jgi:hypothetical protein